MIKFSKTKTNLGTKTNLSSDIDNSECLTFDDVTLKDKFSEVQSRSQITLSTYSNKRNKRYIPIVSASMESINSVEMGIKMLSASMCYIHHRYCSLEERVKVTKEIHDNVTKLGFSEGLLGFAVGYSDLEELSKFNLEHIDIVSLDIAGAYNVRALSFSKSFLEKFPDKIFMIGNFSNSEFIDKFVELAIDEKHVNYSKKLRELEIFLKTSQGGGSVCTTRIATGVGIPTLEATYRVSREIEYSNYNLKVVSDGGIRNPGDMLKCFVAGADMVMIGSMLAGHDECPNPNQYSGMASSEAKQKAGMASKNVEGVTVEIHAKGHSVSKTLDYIKESLQSGLSLMGLYNLEDCIGQISYMEKVSSAAYREAKPHKEGVKNGN